MKVFNNNIYFGWNDEFVWWIKEREYIAQRKIDVFTYLLRPVGGMNYGSYGQIQKTKMERVQRSELFKITTDTYATIVVIGFAAIVDGAWVAFW